jgi:hypothetical protein
MSRQAIKTLDALLEGEESIAWKDAMRLLEYLGFEHRYANGPQHNRWKHPETGVTIQFTTRKSTDTIWGFQLKDLKDAVNQVLEKAKRYKKENGEQIKMAAVTISPPPTLHAVADEPDETKNTINISRTALPDEVLELVWECEQGKLKSNELVDWLNESGYRTTTGAAFSNNNYYSVLMNSKSYTRWKEERTAMHVKPAPAQDIELKNLYQSRVVVDPDYLLASITHLVEENKKLKAVEAERDELKAKLAQIENLLKV